VLVSDFDFHLPEELIAKEPLADRAASRMLHLDRRTGAFEDRMFRDFPDLLRADDLLVFNNTRVFPARLFGHRGGLHAQRLSQHNPAMRQFLHGRVEVLLTKQVSSFEFQVSSEGKERPLQEKHPGADETRHSRRQEPDSRNAKLETGNCLWNALVRPGRKIDVGEHLFFGEHDELHAEVVGRGEFGERTLRFDPVPDFFAAIEQIGHVPLPPYIHRPDRPEDRERYQTVFARERGSVAAPTAGLHFTPEIFDRIRARGIEIVEITLHVGLGTFQPVHVAVVEEHKLHREWYSISEEAAAAINRALAQGRRVVAVGTTTVRTLEYAAAIARDVAPPAAGEGTGATNIRPGSGEADIFIYPGFRFRVVGAMLTNFHLPQSTLLMLVSALAGREHILAAYKHAVESRYRFFSYGDCMFIE
jgi:S-adenosylmethionine:tRNA ribosyltransferase-isomerase